MTLPNWLKLVLGLSLVIVTWIMNQQANGQLVLPATIVTALTIAKTVLSMLTDGVPTAIATKRARLAAMRVSSVLALAATLVLFLLGCQGCTSQQGQTVIPPIIDVSTCIIRVIGDDVAKGQTWAEASDDAITQCLLGHAPTAADRLQYAPIVEREWSAVEAADAKRGLVAKPISGRHGAP